MAGSGIESKNASKIKLKSHRPPLQPASSLRAGIHTVLQGNHHRHALQAHKTNSTYKLQAKQDYSCLVLLQRSLSAHAAAPIYILQYVRCTCIFLLQSQAQESQLQLRVHRVMETERGGGI